MALIFVSSVRKLRPAHREVLVSWGVFLNFFPLSSLFFSAGDGDSDIIAEPKDFVVALERSQIYVSDAFNIGAAAEYWAVDGVSG